MIGGDSQNISGFSEFMQKCLKLESVQRTFRKFKTDLIQMSEEFEAYDID